MPVNEPSILQAIQTISARSVVHESVIRALIATHPDPSSVRLVAESLLMQAQSRLASSDLWPQQIAAPYQQILDALFQPPIHLQPDEG